MNTLFKYNTSFPNLSDFIDSPLRPLAETNFSLFDNFFEGHFPNQKIFLPYNTIVHDENSFSIEVALAGWSKEDFTVTLDHGQIFIQSKIQNSECGTEDKSVEVKFPYYLHKGIAKRAFSFKFQIPKNAEVSDPEYKDGLLSIKVTKPKPEENPQSRILKVK